MNMRKRCLEGGRSLPPGNAAGSGGGAAPPVILRDDKYKIMIKFESVICFLTRGRLLERPVGM